MEHATHDEESSDNEAGVHNALHGVLISSRGWCMVKHRRSVPGSRGGRVTTRCPPSASGARYCRLSPAACHSSRLLLRHQSSRFQKKTPHRQQMGGLGRLLHRFSAFHQVEPGRWQLGRNNVQISAARHTSA